MGNFDWQKEQKVTFIMKNVGDKLLAIEGWIRLVAVFL